MPGSALRQIPVANSAKSLTVLDHAVQAVSVGLVVTDHEGTILWANPAFTAITGYASEEVVGQNPRIMQSGKQTRAFYERMWSTILAGDTWRGELVNRRKDGQLYTEELLITPVRDEDGQITHFVAMKQDVTERQRSERALRESRGMLRDIAQGITAAVMLISADHRILWANHAAVSRFGQPNEPMIGQLCHVATHGFASPCNSPDHRCPLSEAAATDAPTQATHCHADAAGNERLERVSAYPIRDSEGQVCRFVYVAEDVTEQSQAERKLRDSESLYRSLFESSQDAIMTVDTAGFIDCNPATLALFGIADRYEFATTHPSELSPPKQPDGSPSWPATQRHIEKALRHGSDHYEWTYWRKGGPTFPAEVSLNRLQIAGSPAVMATVRDLSSRKQAEAAHRERESLQEAIAAMEHLFGVVGHELRTPLAGLRATSEFLLTPAAKESAEWDTFLTMLHDEIVRMSELVNNMLEAARLNSGRAKWTWSRVRLLEACDEAFNVVRPLVSHPDVLLYYQVDPASLTMQGDRDAICRLLINFVSNSVKHTTAGSIRVSITSADDAEGKWIVVQITDTGGGIPENIARKLGQAFVLNSGLIGSDYVKGSGLGLAICGGIVAAHGGSIHVASTVGEGSVFTVRLRADLDGPVQTEGALEIEREAIQ